MTEADFLKSLAVNHYNRQYSKKFNIQEFCVTSIAPITGFKYGYEVVTMRQDDFLRLRMYFNLTERDFLSPYRVEVNLPHYNNDLSDEVYVCIGEVDRFYLDSNRYKFRSIDTCGVNFLLFEDATIFETEDGDPIVFE